MSDFLLMDSWNFFAHHPHSEGVPGSAVPKEGQNGPCTAELCSVTRVSFGLGPKRLNVCTDWAQRVHSACAQCMMRLSMMSLAVLGGAYVVLGVVTAVLDVVSGGTIVIIGRINEVSGAAM